MTFTLTVSDEELADLIRGLDVYEDEYSGVDLLQGVARAQLLRKKLEDLRPDYPQSTGGVYSLLHALATNAGNLMRRYQRDAQLSPEESAVLASAEEALAFWRRRTEAAQPEGTKR